MTSENDSVVQTTNTICDFPQLVVAFDDPAKEIAAACQHELQAVPMGVFVRYINSYEVTNLPSALVNMASEYNKPCGIIVSLICCSSETVAPALAAAKNIVRENITARVNLLCTGHCPAVGDENITVLIFNTVAEMRSALPALLEIQSLYQQPQIIGIDICDVFWVMARHSFSARIVGTEAECLAILKTKIAASAGALIVVVNYNEPAGYEFCARWQDKISTLFDTKERDLLFWASRDNELSDDQYRVTVWGG